MAGGHGIQGSQALPLDDALIPLLYLLGICRTADTFPRTLGGHPSKFQDLVEKPIPKASHRFSILQEVSSGWWARATPLKNMSSSIGMIIPNIWENKKWQPNHQPVLIHILQD